jgi:hypothetical protein
VQQPYHQVSYADAIISVLLRRIAGIGGPVRRFWCEPSENFRHLPATGTAFYRSCAAMDMTIGCGLRERHHAPNYPS